MIRKYAEISPCGKYRYHLSRIWDVSCKTLTYVMLNPSTADADNDDRTISRLIKFSKAWGYGGFHVVNLFAYRATKPEDMFQALKDGVDIIGPDNDRWLRDALNNPLTAVVYAWGGNGHVLDRATAIAGMCQQDAFCIETSGHGFPKHPLYLKSASKLNLVHLNPKTMKFIIPASEHQRPLPATLRQTNSGMVVELDQ